MERQWTLEGHSSQIADTGDYDGHYELTDGVISLVTKDDVCGEDAARLTAMLNEMGVNWEDWNLDSAKFETYLEKENCAKWKAVAEKLYYELIAAVALLNQPREQIRALKEYDLALHNLPDPGTDKKNLLLQLRDIEQIARIMRGELIRTTEYKTGVGTTKSSVEFYDRYIKVKELLDKK